MNPSPKHLPDNVPFTGALDLAIKVPVNDTGITDVYIDNLIPVCPNLGRNDDRASAAGPLSLHILGREVSTNEPITCNNLSEEKATAEGGISEIQTVLGWVINTRSLTISLADKMFMEWSNDI